MSSEKKRIGFDLDGVIVPFEDGLIDYYNKVHIFTPLGKSQKLEPVKLEDIVEYDLTVVFKQYESHSDVNKDILIPYEDSEIYKALIPMEGSFDVLKKLVDLGYELCVITSRGENLREFTHQYLEKYFKGIFKEENIWLNKHFKGRRLTKGEVCKEMNVSYMVDDALHNCNGVTTSTNQLCTSFLFGKTPWDNDDSKLKSGVYRSLTWTSLFEKLMKLEKKK